MQARDALQFETVSIEFPLSIHVLLLVHISPPTNQTPLLQTKIA